MYRIVVPPTLTPKEMEAAGVTGETGVLRLTLSYSPKTEESHEFPLPLSLAASPTAEGVRKVVHASSLLPRLLIASKRQGERDGDNTVKMRDESGTKERLIVRDPKLPYLSLIHI